jgi:hypothetical protein
MSKYKGRVGKLGMSKPWPNRQPPMISPAKKAQRQLSGLAGADKTSDVMLLMPAIRPKPHQSSQLAKPIRTPPMAAMK